jgi:Family of unknown function (DUF6941)
MNGEGILCRAAQCATGLVVPCVPDYDAWVVVESALDGVASMTTAALTPRVRIMVVCDEVVPSETENAVFTLDGVRQHITPRAFPCAAQLNVFLLLSSPRNGSYNGRVLVLENQADRTIRYVKFLTTFTEDDDSFAASINLGECVFHTPGTYTFQVWFSVRDGEDVLKAELPFTVHALEE